MRIQNMPRFDVEKALSFWRQGMTTEEVAQAVGTKAYNMRYHLRKRGFYLKGNSPRTVFLPDDPVTLAYIAGIVDGEGYVSRSQFEDSPRSWNFWHVQVTNTHKGLIDWLASFGGAHRAQPQQRKPHHKICYIWSVAGRANVHHVLHQLLPYLRVKAEVAHLVLRRLHQIQPCDL